MKQFLKDYGTLMIAVYGVLQVWFLGIWRRYFRRGQIIVYPSGNIELGHSNFGPTVAINGTLLAKNKDVFLSSMQIEVKRKKDGAAHVFSWTAFRPPVVNVLNPRNIEIEIPSGFIVNQDNPRRYNVFFSDRNVQEEFAPRLVALQQAWGKYLVDNSQSIDELTRTGLSHQGVIEKKFNEEFLKTKECHDAWDIIQRRVYWEEGGYEATLEIFTDDITRKFQHKFGFDVDSTSYDKFRTNSVATIREICLREVNYYFAYAAYAS